VLPRLDVSVYADAGDVGGEAWRFSGEGPVSNWGGGLVIRAENFPVRVDVAFPLETLEGDRANEPGGAHVSFSAGYVF
jgi:outer membrane protein assembly factor BamA